VLRTRAKAAASTIPVLVEGESGVGKELFGARHPWQRRTQIKAVCCRQIAAIPDNLVESILFGH